MEQTLHALREQGAEVRVEQANVADPAQLEAALAPLGESQPPLVAVFHAAGVLEDALLPELDEDALQRALAGKACGALNLHRLTRDQPIDPFVLFSSFAGLAGTPSQAAYAAANTFLDALARHRAALGLPAVSIAWTTWAGSGLAVAAGGVERLAAAGVPPLDPTVGLELIEEAVGSGRAQVAAAAFDWERLKRALAGPAARELLGELVHDDPEQAAERGTLRDAILALDSQAERKRMMREFLVERVAEVLRIAPTDVDTEAAFQDLGFDSLMAIEVRDRLEVALGMRLSAAVLYAHPTPQSLADGLVERIESAGAPPPPPPASGTEGPASGDGSPDDVSKLGEDELADLLAEELDTMGGS